MHRYRTTSLSVLLAVACGGGSGGSGDDGTATSLGSAGSTGAGGSASGASGGSGGGSQSGGSASGSGTAGSTTGDCVDTVSDPDNCGTCGHSCHAGGCVDGVCQPAMVAPPPPVDGVFGSMTASGGAAYVHFSSGNLAVVQRIPADGGGPVILEIPAGLGADINAEAELALAYRTWMGRSAAEVVLVADDAASAAVAFVYTPTSDTWRVWSFPGHDFLASGGPLLLGKDGQTLDVTDLGDGTTEGYAPLTVVDGTTFSAGTDGTAVFLVDGDDPQATDSNGTVYRLPAGAADFNAAIPLSTSPTPGRPFGTWHDGAGRVYWVHGDRLYAADDTTPGPSTLLATIGPVPNREVLSISERVYWLDTAGIHTVALDGSDETLVTGGTITAFAEDGVAVYWLQADGFYMRAK